MIRYEMICMIDLCLKQVKNRDGFFGDINILIFSDVIQLRPVGGYQLLCKPENMQLAVHLWSLFTFVGLANIERLQGKATFIGILNALRFGEMSSEHMVEFSIEKALRIIPKRQI